MNLCCRLLQQATAVLEEASQTSDSQRRACGDIAAALVQKPLSDHQDKVGSALEYDWLADVQLHSRPCFAPSVYWQCLVIQCKVAVNFAAEPN